MLPHIPSPHPPGPLILLIAQFVFSALLSTYLVWKRQAQFDLRVYVSHWAPCGFQDSSADLIRKRISVASAEDWGLAGDGADAQGGAGNAEGVHDA